MQRLVLLLLLLSGIGACQFFKAKEKKADETASVIAASDLIPAFSEQPKQFTRPNNSTCLAWNSSAETPRLLSLTGCFDRKDPRQPVAALLPYFVSMSFWSDGADKRRWFALPNDTQITWDAKGQVTFPIGTILVKEFIWQGKRIETRFFLRHPTDGWVGYSYEWNDSENEATLVGAEGKTFEWVGQTWSIPSSQACFRCHNNVVGPPLGWEAAQINTNLAQFGGMNQIEYLQKMGIVPENLPFKREALPQLRAEGDGTDEEKARSYLHVNCAICHRPGGQVPGSIDLRKTTSFAAMKVCDVVPEIDDLGLPDARLVKPKSPESSVLIQRMMRNDYSRMPPLASHRVDDEGVALIRAWINGMSNCP